MVLSLIGLAFRNMFLVFADHVSPILRGLMPQVCIYPSPQYMLATLIHAFITSRLDFCNTLLYNVPGSKTNRIQVFQNSCAKFLSRTKQFESAYEQLKTLLAPD